RRKVILSPALKGGQNESGGSMKRHFMTGAILLAIIAALGIGSVVLEKKSVVQAAAVQAPKFEVDPMWPKPLPNHWIMGSTIGVSVDDRDHVWIIHRPG